MWCSSSSSSYARASNNLPKRKQKNVIELCVDTVDKIMESQQIMVFTCIHSSKANGYYGHGLPLLWSPNPSFCLPPQTGSLPRQVPLGTLSLLASQTGKMFGKITRFLDSISAWNDQWSGTWSYLWFATSRMDNWSYLVKVLFESVCSSSFPPALWQDASPVPPHMGYSRMEQVELDAVSWESVSKRKQQGHVMYSMQFLTRSYKLYSWVVERCMFKVAGAAHLVKILISVKNIKNPISKEPNPKLLEILLRM